VGSLGASLKTVNAGVDASTSTFFSDVYAQTVNITGTGVVILNGDLNGDLSYADNGVVRLTGSSNMITGDVTNDTGTDAQGTLTFDTSVVVLGQVGAEDASLQAVNAGANGSSVTLSGDVHAQSTNITGTGVLVVDGDLYGALTYTDNGTVILASDNTIYGTVTNNTGTDGQGILTLDGSGTASEQVGGVGASLQAVNAGENGTSSNFLSDVYAQNMNITGTGVVALGGNLNGALSYDANGVVVLEAGATITGDVSNDTGIDERGTLTLAGDGSVLGQIGDTGASLLTVNAGVDGTSAIFSSSIYTQVMNITGTGLVVLNGDLVGALSYDADGMAVLADNTDITGIVTNDTGIDGQGTLNLYGTSNFSQQVGAVGASLLAVDAGADGSSSIFSSDVYTQAMNITGTGAVTLNGDLNGALSYQNDGSVTLGDGTAITGTVRNDTGMDGMGELTFEGGGTVLFQVGAADAALRAVNAGADMEAVSFMNDVYAQTINITGAGTVTLNADLNGALRYSGDGIFILANNRTITGAVTTAADGQGTLALAGSTVMASQVGAAGASLKAMNAGADGSISTFSGDIYTQSLNVVGTGDVTLEGDLNGALSYGDDGIVTVADNKTIAGAVSNDSGLDLQGELNFIGTHTTGGTIGIVGGNALRAVNITQGTFTMAHDMAAGAISVDESATLLLNGDRTITDGNLIVGGTGGAAVDLGQHTLTLDNGGVNFASGTTINLTVSDASTYGRIVQAAADAVLNLGTTININVTGYVPYGTLLTVIDGNGGSGVPGGLTVVDNDMIVTFIVNAVAGPDLILTAITSYDPAGFGGSTAAVAETLSIIENQDVSDDMRAIFTELHTASTALAVSQAVTQMRPYEGTAIVDQTYAFSSAGRRAAMAHLDMVRNNSVKDPETSRRLEVIGRALDEYEDPRLGYDIDASEEILNADIWVQGVASDADQGARNGVEGYTALARGIIVGLDMLKLDMMVFGMAAGYGTSEIDPDQYGIGDIDIDHYPLILYAELHGIRPWRINAALSVARNSYQTERTIRFGSIDRTTSGSFDGQQYDFYIEGVYDLLVSSFKLTPSLSLDYSYITLDAYEETGADALDLSVESEEYSHLRSGVGLAASTLWNLAKVRIVPQIYGKCQYEWLNPSIKTTAAFKGTSTSFETTAVESSDNTVETGMSWDFLLPKEMSLRFNYDAEFSQEYSANILSAQFKSKF